MEESTTVNGTEGDAPVAEKRAGAGLIAAYAFAYIGLWMALLTPILISLPIRVQQIDPEGKTGSLSLILAIGALLAMVSNPFFGRLSDRTTSRFGMRRPWLLIGAIGGTLGLLMIALAPSILVVLIGWCLTQVALNIMLAVSTAILPDQIPFEQRGMVSGILAMCTSIAPTGGALIVSQLSHSTFWMFMAPPAILLVGTLILVFVLNDRTVEPKDVPPYDLGEFLRSFWVNPVAYPDFGWAWLGRFMRFLALSFVLSYQAYYLIDHVNKDPGQVAHIVFVGTIIACVLGIIGANGGGTLSDRTNRRKVYIMSGAIIYAVALLILALTRSVTYFYMAIGISGLGQGIFMALDFALAADVLPEGGKNAAKDLGVFNIASALPQSLAPAIAPLLLAMGAGNNYTSLFICGAVFALLGALVVKPIKGVR